jgi:signal transduction histidine kinase
MDDDKPPNARSPVEAGVLLTDDGCALAVDPGTGAGGSADSLIRASQIDVLDFLASTLVHDLCGPLHNVQLKLSLLQASFAQAEELPESAALHRRCLEHAQTMQQEITRLHTAIRELPELFLPPCAGPVRTIDVAALLAEVVRLMTPQCRLRRLHCACRLPAESLLWIEGQWSALRLALLAIFVALIRHTERGGELHYAAKIVGDRVEIVFGAEGCSLPAPVPGLIAARLIVESQHGELAEAERADGRLRLQLSLPRREPEVQQSGKPR